MKVRRTSKSKPQRAFTIAELLVTLALATLLLVSMLGIVTRLFAHRRILEEQTPSLAWSQRLKKHVEYDFQNCRGVLIKSNQLIFSGFSNQGDGDQIKSHSPGQVVYMPIAVADRAVLVRREYRVDTGNSFPTSESLMCVDVDQITSLTRLETDVPPGVLNLVWSGATDGKEFQLPMVLVRHGVIE